MKARRWIIRLLACVLMFGMIMQSPGASAQAEKSYRAAADTDIFTQMIEFLFGSQGKEEEKMMYSKEMINALRELGIEVPDEKVKEFEENAAEWNKEFEKMGMSSLELDATSLLMSLGIGDFDYDTGVWTPSSSDVYAFDAEIYEIEKMYTLFLQGVASIVPGFEPVDVEEKITMFEETPELQEKRAQAEQEGKMLGEGITAVSFSINGHTYQRELGFFGDWFNDDAIAWINEVLEQEGFDGRLRYYDDGTQLIFLLYGDENFAQKLQAIIGRPECSFRDQ